MTYLIANVEDNESNMRLLNLYLHQKGFDTIEATNGMEAIEQTIRYSPDLILMDLQMPYMDGWEATRRLRCRAQSKHIPIIAVSAYIGKEDIRKLINAGFNDYIRKPLNIRSDEILNKIQRQIEVHPPKDILLHRNRWITPPTRIRAQI